MKALRSIYYGWWLVLVCLVLGAIGGGTSFYVVSLIADALEQEFAASRAQIMLAVTGHNLLTGLLAPKLSSLMDQVSIRRVLSVSALVAGAGYGIIGVSPSIWGFVGSYALLVPALIVSLTSLCPAILLSRWFVRYRGSAIGIAALGTQVGGFLFPPLIALMFAMLGWRMSMLLIGLMIAVVIPVLVRATVVEFPADRGLAPDGDRVDLPTRPVPGTGVALKALVRTALWSRNFWMLSFGLALMVGMYTAVLSNLALFAIDIGVARERAALLISLYSAVGILFSIIIGRLCDLLDIRLVFAGMLLVNIGSMVLYAASESFAGLAVATAVVAISGGGFMPMWGSLIGKLFDSQIYARMFGLVSFVALCAAAISPLFSGWVYDLTGSYRIMFLLIAGLMSIPVLYTPLLKLRRVEAVPPPV
jgi:MFS family permease